jgi:Concanavalin A-like lectin/glucanases superfamily
MVRMSRAAGRAIGLLAMLDAACVFEFDADYAGTRYVCEADDACPDGFSCVNGRCVDAPPADFTDDAAGGGFEAGTFSATETTGEHVRLIEGETEGTFRSRVFDSGRKGSSWSRLEWTPGAPYGIALPDDRAAESYLAGNADMSENILLLHAELDGQLGIDAPLTDSSGRENHARVVGAALGTDTGVFGSGFADSFASRLEIDLTRNRSAEDFSTGTDDFTWSLWLRTSEACLGKDSLGNDTYLGADDDRDTGGAHLWFGCARAASKGCPAAGPDSGRLGGTLISRSNDETDGGGYCGTGAINDDVWHHLVLTKTGHSPATVATYIDGAPDFSGPIMFNAPIVFDAGKPFNIAGEPTPRETAGTFDEIAVWRRALDPEELRALYLRGVRQLRIQVRACAQPDCADDPPFVGPDSTADTFFVDPGGASSPEVRFELDGVRGRYFQYLVTFTGIAAPDGSPELHAVRLDLAP